MQVERVETLAPVASDVEQDAAADDAPFAPPVDRQAAPQFGRVVGEAGPESGFAGADVSQPVPLGRSLRGEVVESVVPAVAAGREHVVA